MAKASGGDLRYMTTREEIMEFVTNLDFSGITKEWQDFFDKNYAEAGEMKTMIDEIVNDDDAVKAGIKNGAAYHSFLKPNQYDSVMDVVVFVLYLWYRKNVLNDPNIALDFPEEL